MLYLNVVVDCAVLTDSTVAKIKRKGYGAAFAPRTYGIIYDQNFLQVGPAAPGTLQRAANSLSVRRIGDDCFGRINASASAAGDQVELSVDFPTGLLRLLLCIGCSFAVNSIARMQSTRLSKCAKRK